MYKVLITGGIGSGKSTVCKMFQNIGVHVYDSDFHASIIINSNEEVVEKIKENFGEEIYEDDKLKRKQLADIVFNDKEKLKILNSIMHPAVSKDFEKWCRIEEENGDFPYVIEEAAIAIEIGIQDKFDKVIVVTADEDIKIERVMARDFCYEDKVRDRMKNQMSDEERVKHADYVIVNNNDSNIETQVSAINKEIMKHLRPEIV